MPKRSYANVARKVSAVRSAVARYKAAGRKIPRSLRAPPQSRLERFARGLHTAKTLAETVLPYASDAYSYFSDWVSGPKTVPTVRVTRPAAVGFLTSGPRGKASDIKDFTFNYIWGGTVVGDSAHTGQGGFLNFTPAAYLGTTNAICTSGVCPVAPGDTAWGLPGFGQIMVQFTRIVFKRLMLEVIPVRGSSTDTGLVCIAPVRGFNYAVTWGTSSSTSISASTVIDMSGSKMFPMWEGAKLDLTPYIAGGSGAKENEFPTLGFLNNSNSQTNEISDWLSIPCGIILGGQTQVTSNFQTHIFRVHATVDLLDWTANPFVNNPTLRRTHKQDKNTTGKDDLGLLNLVRQPYPKTEELPSLQTNNYKTNGVSRSTVASDDDDSILVTPTPRTDSKRGHLKTS